MAVRIRKLQRLQVFVLFIQLDGPPGWRGGKDEEEQEKEEEETEGE